MSPACRIPSNSMKTLCPLIPAGSLKCLRYHESPLYVPLSPPPCEMIVRKESTSLKLCGVATVDHLESSNAGASAPATSSRIKRQSQLKFSVTRADFGGTYGDPFAGPAANAG